MHLKTLLLITCALFFSACSKKNSDFYEAHIDEANTKMQQCKALMDKALKAKDQKTLETLSNDLACNSATKVVNAHHQQLAKITQTHKSKEPAEQQQKTEALAHHTHDEHLTPLPPINELTYRQIYVATVECIEHAQHSNKAKCAAYQEMSDKKQGIEIEKLKAKYINGSLSEFSKVACLSKGYKDVDCKIAKKAENQQKREKIAYYLSNKNILKQEFNACHERFIALKKAKNRKQANELKNTYQCSMVAKAALTLKIYNFNRPME